MSKLSQCSCCGKAFKVKSDEVLYCSVNCREDHDLFKEAVAKEKNKKMPGKTPGKKPKINTLIIA